MPCRASSRTRQPLPKKENKKGGYTQARGSPPSDLGEVRKKPPRERPTHAGPETMARLLALLLAGCPPTLSRPESEAHLDALAAGERHYRHGRWDESAEAFAGAADA